MAAKLVPVLTLSWILMISIQVVAKKKLKFDWWEERRAREEVRRQIDRGFRSGSFWSRISTPNTEPSWSFSDLLTGQNMAFLMIMLPTLFAWLKIFWAVFGLYLDFHGPSTEGKKSKT